MNDQKLNSYMVQYSLWPNCCNNCDFCLRKDRSVLSKDQQIKMIRAVKKNIPFVDWENKFSAGISLLGGELYYVKDKQIQDEFMSLIDVIIQRIFKVSKNKKCRFSTVTNGLYEPSFLYRVIDKIVDETKTTDSIDVNFSFDLKYRYKSIEDQNLVLKNINDFHERYNYGVGVQMILTQNLINLCKSGKFSISEFIQNEIPGNNFCLLYPHKIMTGKTLTDFYFNRNDFINFIAQLRKTNFEVYRAFVYSVKHSSLFKYSGCCHYRETLDYSEQPVLYDDKAVLNDKCGHSILYKCYADTDQCMLCDLYQLDSDTLF